MLGFLEFCNRYLTASDKATSMLVVFVVYLKSALFTIDASISTNAIRRCNNRNGKNTTKRAACFLVQFFDVVCKMTT